MTAKKPQRRETITQTLERLNDEFYSLLRGGASQEYAMQVRELMSKMIIGSTTRVLKRVEKGGTPVGALLSIPVADGLAWYEVAGISQRKGTVSLRNVQIWDKWNHQGMLSSATLIKDPQVRGRRLMVLPLTYLKMLTPNVYPLPKTPKKTKI